MVALTWNNWWLDARLAGPAHALDIIVFSLIVVLTLGYTSPVIPFFMFLLLSAAIRWGWRETALTAILLTLLYLVSGLLAVPAGNLVEMQHFVVRTGHVVILSLILIWFGINQWGGAPLAWDKDRLAETPFDQSPVQTGLRAAMAALGARTGCFAWLEGGEVTCLAMADDRSTSVSLHEAEIAGALATTPFLYDLPRGRALRRDAERNLHALVPSRRHRTAGGRRARAAGGNCHSGAVGCRRRNAVPGRDPQPVDRPYRPWRRWSARTSRPISSAMPCSRRPARAPRPARA